MTDKKDVLDALLNSCPIPISEHKEIVLGHGSGGRLTHRLIERMVLPQFKNELLEPLHDGAILPINGSRIAFSTDSYVVKPIFFPGGDIGKLAVNGTVNDLAMCGSRPLYLSAAFILEEGFAMQDLWRVILSMQEAAKNAGVLLVTGDTKVVDRGKGDLIYINTSGVGLIEKPVHIDPRRVKGGDKILVNGAIASHGIAIMSVRENLEFETVLESDTAPLHDLVSLILDAAGDAVHVLRDPTRGGVASTLNEIAQTASVGITLDQASIPIDEQAKAACEILGFDPLYVANEGKLLAFVAPEKADAVLSAMRKHPLGERSAIIGEVIADHPRMVILKTQIGSTRIVDMISGEQLPRIC